MVIGWWGTLDPSNKKILEKLKSHHKEDPTGFYSNGNIFYFYLFATITFIFALSIKREGNPVLIGLHVIRNFKGHYEFHVFWLIGLIIFFVLSILLITCSNRTCE